MNAGIIKISDEVLLRLLQFPNGEILDVHRDPDFPRTIDLAIEHYEMPEVALLSEVKVVEPTYIRYSNGNNSIDIRQPLGHSE